MIARHIRVGSSGFEEEVRLYLQGRLRMLAGVVAVLAGLMFLAVRWSYAAAHGWGSIHLLDPRCWLHLGAWALATAIFFLLGRRDPPMRRLRLLDGVMQVLTVGTCAGLYALAYRQDSEVMIPILCLFLLARAVVVPSSGRRTFWLSLPALPAVLVTQLAFGSTYALDGRPLAPQYFWNGVVLWDQVVLGCTVAVAVIASRINFGLRRQVFEAKSVGQYVMEEKIGEGAMGEVYRATHALLKRPTAIKVLRPEITARESLDRFEREVQLTSSLRHPNTIEIYDYGQTADGRFFYAMEYLPGFDLQRLVEREGPLPPARVVSILAQACAALDEAHQRGLVHRDIKPSNLMVSDQAGARDVLKVLDFGLVKQIRGPSTDLTQEGVVVGTPETMSPEMLAGAEVGPAADIYALGAVGCFLLTGKPIFDARSVPEFIAHHFHSPPVPPSRRGIPVPAELEALLLRCLAKNPSDRPAGVQELRAALLALTCARENAPG